MSRGELDTIADADILAWAQEHASRTPPPVCAGCPDGQFDQQIAIWLATLAGIVSAASGDQWEWVEAFPARYALVRRNGEARQVVVAEQGPGLHGAKTLVLEPVPIPGLVDRDRIAELLAGQQQLREEVRNLHQAMVARFAASHGMLQRCLLWVHHFGSTPWVGSVGRFKLTLTREVAPPDDPPRPT